MIFRIETEKERKEQKECERKGENEMRKESERTVITGVGWTRDKKVVKVSPDEESA